MEFVTKPGPYQRSKRKTSHIMLELSLALLLVVIVAICFQFKQSATLGFYAMAIIAVALISTLAVDIVVGLIIGHRDVKKLSNYVFKNYSYVTALIFSLTLPVYTHLYVVAVGAIVATLIGKAIFGGFGKNIVNPAILGRVFVSAAFGAMLPDGKIFNTFAHKTSVTLTGDWVNYMHNGWFKSELVTGSGKFTMLDLLLGNYQGALGETFTLLLLAIGILLIIRKVIDYRQPLFYLGTVAIASLLIAFVSKNNEVKHVIDNPLNYVILQLSLGGLMFGAIFMITDPVTTPTSPAGKIIASILAGLLTVVIRVKIGAVEGVMYSILFVNLLTPLIDGLVKGATTNHIFRKWINIGAFGATALLITSMVGYIPKAKEKEAPAGSVAYTGEYMVPNAEDRDYPLTVKVTLYFINLKLEELDVDTSDVSQGYKDPLERGSFFQNNITGVKGMLASELKAHFTPLTDFEFLKTLAARATYTAYCYVMAMLDAAEKALVDEVAAATPEPAARINMYHNSTLIFNYGGSGYGK